jgi:hypothetical protein
MTLQGSGAISISQIRTEISCNGTYSLRSLSSQAGKGTSDSMSEFYGYSHTISLSVLLVAGGGSGGQHMGGGGGGGGSRVDGYTATKGGGGIGVTVGGGAGGRNGDCDTYYATATGAMGGSSYFGGNHTYGGGGGGGWYANGGGGGCGGGVGIGNGVYVGDGTAGQGYAGGQSLTFGGGGGGGAGAVGQNAVDDAGGRGGNARNFYDNGFTEYNWQGQGGSGGSYWNIQQYGASYDNGSHPAFGGFGGGGGEPYCSSFNGNDRDGIANRGQGAGGEGDCPCRRGGNGGSGIVQVRYAGGTQASGGNYTYTSGGYTIHVFTSSGTFTPSC